MKTTSRPTLLDARPDTTLFLGIRPSLSRKQPLISVCTAKGRWKQSNSHIHYPVAKGIDSYFSYHSIRTGEPGEEILSYA
jgi:hypothetical protein